MSDHESNDIIIQNSYLQVLKRIDNDYFSPRVKPHFRGVGGGWTADYSLNNRLHVFYDFANL